MRFLFECVSCYGAARLDPPTNDFSNSSSTAMATAEETRQLVSLSSTQRRRSRSLSKQGTGDWKPSLHAISEDIVAAPVKARAKAAAQMTRAAATATAAATARRSGKRCAPSPPPSAHSRGRGGDTYCHDPQPMIIVPAFAATPFLMF